MKIVIVLAVAVACALAAPTDDKDAQVISFNSDIRPDGSFNANYETNNGIASRDAGELREGRDEKNNILKFLVREGQYSFKDPEGEVHAINWFADENGYRAEGADIPK